MNKLSALRTDPVCFSFRSLLELAEVIFSSKPLKKSSITMFPFSFQLSDDFCEVFGRKSRIGFSVAISNGRFLQGRSQDFSKGGSHWVIQRVLTRLSPEYCGLFTYKKAYKGGVTGTPGPPPLATPFSCVYSST